MTAHAIPLAMARADILILKKAASGISLPEISY